MGKMLIDEYPLLVLPKLATIIGLNEALITQQIHFWMMNYKEKGDLDHFHDGRWWVWNTIDEWNENFPFWSKRTIRRTLKSLRSTVEAGEEPFTPGNYPRNPLVIVGNYNKKKYDRTLWYTIDYDEVNRVKELWCK